jgi:hypothetical protein
MRVFKDSLSLKHDNFNANQGRRFRSGHMSPFSANMAFVLHKCNQTLFSDTSSDFDKYKVSVLVNEMPIELYGLGEVFECSSEAATPGILSVCDFRSFKRMLHSYLNDNMSDVCRPGMYPKLDVSKYVSFDFEKIEL